VTAGRGESPPGCVEAHMHAVVVAEYDEGGLAKL